MYEKDGDYYLSANAVEETKSLRKNTVEIGDFQLDGKGEMKTLGGAGAFEVEAERLRFGNGLAQRVHARGLADAGG